MVWVAFAGGLGLSWVCWVSWFAVMWVGGGVGWGFWCFDVDFLVLRVGGNLGCWYGFLGFGFSWVDWFDVGLV